MRRSALSALSAAIVGLALAALRCTSVLGINGGAITPIPACVGDASNCDICLSYCNSVMQHCPSNAGELGPLTEYLTTDICMQTCSVNIGSWMSESSEALNLDGNTFTCRQAFAGATTSNSCANAGPLGGAPGPNGCAGDPCKTFCQLDLQICTGKNQYYKSEAECEQYCRGRQDWYVQAESGSDLYPHSQGDDTLNCRLYHLQNAMKQGANFGPTTHCPHTSPAGGLPGQIVCGPADAGVTGNADTGADTGGLDGAGEGDAAGEDAADE